MTEAITSPTEEVVPLNALLVEPIPLAFLETVAPDNDFITMNTRAAALLGSPNLPEILPSQGGPPLSWPTGKCGTLSGRGSGAALAFDRPFSSSYTIQQPTRGSQQPTSSSSQQLPAANQQ
jgi:hypothetical protein